MSIKRFASNARMSQMVIHGNVAYLAGQVAADTSASLTGQTEQILAKIDGLLAEAGCDKRQVLSATIWLADHNDFAAMNEVWDAWVPEGHAPARACVESALAFPPYRVEIAVIAGL
ncbi:RidA family protein [Pseudomonas typographi]|uniref:RidA family protein n=1 Tax=Pseudomonas typographi TaxID=2715964 RepID=UPI001684B1BC|nr:RidA family protein [Pseudomonas typographi]MBD1552681.1 RidA family protein [Pseudomonas typographi]